MKRIVCFLMAVLMLSVCGITGYAAEEDTLTTDLIFQRLAEGDEASETAEDQAANGALRLAEMVVALDNIGIETQDEADHLNRILDALAEVDVPEESIEHKIALGLMKTFEALIIFQQQVDPKGVYEEELEQIYNSFLANDDKAEDATQQAVNGLYHSVFVASVIARGFCRDKTMISQIEKEMEAFGEADKTETASDTDQLVLGSETLLRMLTAVGSVLDSEGKYAAELRELSENVYAADDEEAGPMFRLANWLYGCVAMTGMIAEEIEG